MPSLRLVCSFSQSCYFATTNDAANGNDPIPALLNHFIAHVPCRSIAGRLPFLEFRQGSLVAITVRAIFRFALCIADFFPYGTPVANVPVMVGGQVALSNYCAPYGGIITITDVTSSPPIVVGSGPLSSLYCDSYSFNVTFPAVGTRTIRVDYSGDSNVNPSLAIYNQFPIASNVPAGVSLSADSTAAIAGSPVTAWSADSAVWSRLRRRYHPANEYDAAKLHAKRHIERAGRKQDRAARGERHEVSLTFNFAGAGYINSRFTKTG